MMSGLRNTYMSKFSLCLVVTLVIIGCGKKAEEDVTQLRTESKHVVKRGENLEAILDKLSVAESRQQIITALQNAGFPFRKCFR